MIENMDAQSRLHADLESPRAQAAVAVAAANGALGWKVNGAGGEGGSITILCGPESRSKRQLLQALRHTDPLFSIIPTHLSRHGLRVGGLILLTRLALVNKYHCFGRLAATSLGRV